jgi:NAD(P)-dependent dehydrogenase (short-subunit alcohol dehydrogenase family)
LETAAFDQTAQLEGDAMSQANADSASPRAVVITGASSGIGRSCALHLDGLGFHVFAGVRRVADGEALARVASSRLSPIVVDVTDPGAVEAAYQTVSDRRIALAGLVNNAGSTVPCPVEYLPLDTLRKQLEVNLIGHVAMTQAFLPLLRRSRGRLVNISSLAGRLPVPGMGSYTAAKHALEGLSGSLRLELAGAGIHVAVVEPGNIHTSMSAKLHRDVTAALSAMSDDDTGHYGALVRGVEAAITDGAEHGAPPEVVAEAVAHALTSRRPRIRYPVGPQAGRMTLLARVLPDRLLDVMLQRKFAPRPEPASAAALHSLSRSTGGIASPAAPTSMTGVPD